MSAKHTPLPWVPQGEGTLLHPVSNRALTTRRIETSLGFIEILDETNEPEQNFDFILKAAQCHEELIAACQAALDRLVDPYLGEDDGERQQPEVDQLRAILTKAKAPQ